MYRLFRTLAVEKFAVFTLLVVTLSATAGYAEDQDAGRLLLDAIERYASVQTYTCLLDKQVSKNGKLYEDLSIRVKFKKPANYYFRWEKGVRKGREVIFAAGRHDAKIIAHPGGPLRFMTFHLDPEGRLAMKENRHSLSNSGLGKIMQLIEADHHLAQENGLQVVRYVGQARIDDRSTWVIEGRFPENRGFYAPKVVLFIDQTLGLPIKVGIYDASGALLEAYLFHQLAVNVPLTERDFDPANPAYDFF